MQNQPPIIDPAQRRALLEYLALTSSGSSMEHMTPVLDQISTLEWLADTPHSRAVARDHDGEPIGWIDGQLRALIVEAWSQTRWTLGRLAYASISAPLGREVGHA